MHYAARLTAALALSLAAQANASTLSFSSVQEFSGTNSFDFELSRFDPSLGTLTAISLQLSGEVKEGVFVPTGDLDDNGDDVFVFLKSLALRFPTDIQFQADGLFNQTFQVAPFTDYIGTTPFTFSGSNSGDGAFRVDITYDYDADVLAVPSPASLPLVALALAALGWVRVRRPAAG